MGFINGVKIVFSDLKEYINQIDCPDEVELTDPKLVESLQLIKKREEAFKKSSTSNKGNKGGKENSGKQQVVETVAIDPKAVKAMAKEAQKKQQPVVEKDGEER